MRPPSRAASRSSTLAGGSDDLALRRTGTSSAARAASASRKAGEQREPRAASAASGASSAASESRRRRAAGAAPAAAGVEALAERPEHLHLRADLGERRERRATRLAEERDARRRRRRTAESGRARNESCDERAQHVELPGLAGGERALQPDLHVRPERLAGRHARSCQACSSCRLLGSTSQARAIACTAALAAASVVMQGTLAEIAARRIW